MMAERPYLRRIAKLLSLSLLSTLFLFSSNNQSQAVEAGPTFTTVSSGEHFTCGLTSIGDVYCWGDKSYLQLGTSAVDYNSTPNRVYQVTNAVEIAAGRDFACARISDGSVACWGRGDLGQTGDGYLSTENRIFATRVHGVTTATGISAGESHACVLKKDRNVYCWGQNQLFQLGNDLSRVETMPVKVEGISAITQISSGLNHTCALTETQFVYCWGDNKFGQLGIGTPVILKEKPSIVLGLKKVVSLQLGYNSSCASIESIGFNCWGWGIDGELAQTDRFNRSLPEKISLASLVDSATALVAISIGKRKACGLLNSGKSNALLCWGTTVTTDPVSGSTGLSVSLGSDHGCVVQTTGTVACWGWNHKGQLGRATTSNSVLSLSTVSGFPDWTYWIKSWSIKYEDNLGIVSWEGGSGKYIVSIEGKGIVCETLTIRSCKFGPLEPNTTYSGRITAQNSPTENSRTVNISFKTESLTSAFDSYNAAQAKLALQAESDRLTLIAVEKANAATDKANAAIDAANAAAEDKALSELTIVEEQKKLVKEKAEALVIMVSLRQEMIKLEKNLTPYKATSPNIHKLLSTAISAFPAFSQESQSYTLSQAQNFKVEFDYAFRNYINKLVYISNAKSKISCSRNDSKKIVKDINPICPAGYKK
jgi:alpha-tubulin suppressor-like RCC1 family protein